MRKLTILTGLIATLYSGYWYAASSAVQNGAQGAMDQLSADGWQVSYSSLATSGFPTQFSTVLTDARLAPGDGAFAWTAPDIEVRAASYAPNTIIADFPQTQTVEIAGQIIEIDAADLVGSLRSGLATSLPLQDARITSGPITVMVEDDSLTIADALIAITASADDTALYDLDLTINTITLPQAVLDGLAGTNAPDMLDQLRLRGQIAYDQPIDRFAGQDSPLRPTLLTITDLALDWGDTSVAGTMDVTIDSAGAPTGDVQLTVQNWELVLDIAVTTGIVPPEMMTTLGNAGRMLSGGDSTISVDITFDEGEARIGFIPLGSFAFFGPTEG